MRGRRSLPIISEEALVGMLANLLWSSGRSRGMAFIRAKKAKAAVSEIPLEHQKIAVLD
jgi:hypothetical protein